MILSKTNTLSQDITVARNAGFTSDFLYRENRLLCRTNNKWYDKNECYLVEYCRHEELNDPSDSSILFLIECSDGTKGCLSCAYGTYADSDLIEFVLSLNKN